MIGLWPAAAFLLAFLALLLAERLSLDAARRRTAVRVAVTGTRGKSSVVRLIAAALRADGRMVLAKTTGSRPSYSMRAGEERPVPRTGPPTILEQKRVLHAAARNGAGVLVAEMMSIRPECLRAEAGRILKPDLLVITNARVDHREEMGSTAEAAAAALAEAITPGCTVLLPASEDHAAFREAARIRSARLVLVAGPGAGEEAEEEAGTALEFPENKRLAAAAASVLGVPAGRIAAGLSAAVPDFGALRVWRLPPAGASGPRFAVSAFAANEPASTRLILDRLAAVRPGLPERRIGILALREDRPDRTRQWLEAAAEGFFSGFAGLVVAGTGARPVMRRLRRSSPPGAPTVSIARGEAPESILAAAEAGAGPQAAVFMGLGNIAGAGAALVELWDRRGEAA